MPYEDGWSASVNGEPAEVIKTNVGFMAVRCPAGEAVTIRFDYMTPGLIPGLLITCGAALLFVLYLMLFRLYDRRRAARIAVAKTEDAPCAVLLWPAGEPEAGMQSQDNLPPDGPSAEETDTPADSTDDPPVM